MTTVTVRWHPHTEAPTKPVAAIIAIPPDPEDDAGVVLLHNLYTWCQSRGWEHEETGVPLLEEQFWWLNEVDIVAPLDALFGISP